MTTATKVKPAHPFLEVDPKMPYKVADINLATLGHKEMALSEREMPGLMAVREKYGPQQPLKGLKIMGSLRPVKAFSS